MSIRGKYFGHKRIAMSRILSIMWKELEKCHSVSSCPMAVFTRDMHITSTYGTRGQDHQ